MPKFEDDSIEIRNAINKLRMQLRDLGNGPSEDDLEKFQKQSEIVLKKLSEFKSEHGDNSKFNSEVHDEDRMTVEKWQDVANSLVEKPKPGM